LSLYRALIRLRRNNDLLLIGDLRLLAATEHVLAYERRLGHQRVMVALNMTG
jgi:alpha-glucosidase